MSFFSRFLFGVGLAILAAQMAWADALVRERVTLGPNPQTKASSIPFEVSDTSTRVGLSFVADLRRGDGLLEIVDPEDRVLIQVEFRAGQGQFDRVLGPFDTTGTFQVRTTIKNALGEYRVVLIPDPARGVGGMLFLRGMLMALAAICLISVGYVHFGVRPSWFLAGAGVWLLGVVLKLIFAFKTTPLVLTLLDAKLDRPLFLLLGSAYSGLATAIFEIGAVAAAALMWPWLARERVRGLGIAMGGAAVEPLLFGLRVVLVGFAIWLGLNRVPELLGLGPYDSVAVSTANEMSTAHLPWLLVPVESMLVLFAQASARTLALVSVATGRWRYFAGAFAYIALFDAVVSWPRLAERLVFTPLWSVVLLLAPLAFAGFFLVSKALRIWPESDEGVVAGREKRILKRGRAEA